MEVLLAIGFFWTGFVVGRGVGVYAASNVLLPLFWAWPKAMHLHRMEKLIRRIPAHRFLIAPLTWGLLILGSLWLITFFHLWLSGGYYLGLAVGSSKVVKLLFRPNEDMEDDFADTFGEFLR